MIDGHNIVYMAWAVALGIVTDIYRRLRYHNQIREEMATVKQRTSSMENDIKEIKGDVKYLVRRELDKHFEGQ